MNFKTLFLFSIWLSFFLMGSAQPKILTNLKTGLWSDTSIWNYKKLPAQDDIVFLSNDIGIDTSAKCKVFNANGYRTTIKKGGHLQIVGTDTIPTDILNLYNIPSLYSSDTLQAISQKGSITFYLYGIRDILGNLTKITKAQYRTSSTDTIINVIFDDSMRVKACFFAINGLNDSSLYKFRYKDTLVFTSRFFIDWNNNSFSFREIFVSRKNKLLATPIESAKPMNQFSIFTDAVKLAGGAQSAILICNLIIIVATTAAGIIVLPSAVVTGGVLGALGGIVLALKPAKAEEFSNYSVPPPGNTFSKYNELITYQPQIDDDNFIGTTLPLLATNEPKEIADVSVTTGGNILFSGLTPVSSRGVCWSNSPNPTLLNDHEFDFDYGEGSFQIFIYNLIPQTKYYLRAFAINATDTAYGNEVSFLTKDKIFNYIANYKVPGTIINSYIGLKLSFNNGVVTGTAGVSSFPNWAQVTGQITGTTMTLNMKFDNEVVPECEYFIPNPPSCPACKLKVFPGGSYGRTEEWAITGTVNADHSSFSGTYSRKYTSTQLIGHEDCSFTTLVQETTETGIISY